MVRRPAHAPTSGYPWSQLPSAEARRRLGLRGPRSERMRAQSASCSEGDAAASRRDQHVVWHLRARFRDKIQTAAMHRDQYIGLEFFNLRNHLCEIVLWRRTEVEAADNRMDLLNS